MDEHGIGGDDINDMDEHGIGGDDINDMDEHGVGGDINDMNDFSQMIDLNMPQELHCHLQGHITLKVNLHYLNSVNKHEKCKPLLTQTSQIEEIQLQAS